MSRSRKKNPIWRDGSGDPVSRRLARRRMKTEQYAETRYKAVVNTWDVNDITLREQYWEREKREVRERYDRERRRILTGRHPLCIRFGKAEALWRLQKQEEREIYKLTKLFRSK